jgi:hypothetical protein
LNGNVENQAFLLLVTIEKLAASTITVNKNGLLVIPAQLVLSLAQPQLIKCFYSIFNHTDVVFK